MAFRLILHFKFPWYLYLNMHIFDTCWFTIILGCVCFKKDSKKNLKRHFSLTSSTTFYELGNIVNEPIVPTITDITLWNTWRFQYRFHSPQVKWYLLSSTRNIVYELPHELPNDLRLKKIRKYWEYHKNSRRQSLVPSLLSANKNLVVVVKNHAKTDFIVFLSYPILLDFLTLCHKFCPRL